MKDFKLNSEPKIKSGFLTPDNYFDSFADRIMLDLPKKEVKVVPLYRRKPVWVTSVAAVFVLSLSLIFTKEDTSVKAPDAATIESYLVYQADISSYDLLENLDQSDLSELEQSFVISDEAIEQYLSDENVNLYE
jgi:hypothetical protein